MREQSAVRQFFIKAKAPRREDAKRPLAGLCDFAPLLFFLIMWSEMKIGTCPHSSYREVGNYPARAVSKFCAMNVHFIAWMSIALSFLFIGGGAYLVDTLTPHENGLIDIWSHPPFHAQLAHAFFFYGGIYAVCNFVYHLFGLKRVRRDLRRAARGRDWAELAATSRPREGTGAGRLVRLDLVTDTHHAFARAVGARTWEIGSGARALAAASALIVLAALFATTMECINVARGVALTGVGYEPTTLGWSVAAVLSYVCTGIFIALGCFFGFYILREGARQVAAELEQLVPGRHASVGSAT